MGRKNKRTKKQIKELIENIIARFIYNAIITTVLTSAIILLFATLSTLVDLCMSNKMICVCFFIVSSYYIIKEIAREINR